jgi:hypothetical protein
MMKSSVEHDPDVAEYIGGIDCQCPCPADEDMHQRHDEQRDADDEEVPRLEVGRVIE